MRHLAIVFLFILVGCSTERNSSVNERDITSILYGGREDNVVTENERRFYDCAKVCFIETIDEVFTEEEKIDLAYLLDDPSVRSLLFCDSQINEEKAEKALLKIQTAKTDVLWRLFDDDFIAIFKSKIDAEYDGIMSRFDSIYYDE